MKRYSLHSSFKSNPKERWPNQDLCIHLVDAISCMAHLLPSSFCNGEEGDYKVSGCFQERNVALHHP